MSAKVSRNATGLRPTWWEQQPQPRDRDVIDCGPLTIRVGGHNGEFRSILIEDHLRRPIAHGEIPFRALQQIIDAGGKYTAYDPNEGDHAA